MELGVGVLPGGGGEVEFFEAEAGEEFGAGPAGFAGDLGEEAAGALADGEVDAVGFQVKVGGGAGTQRGDDADLDEQARELIEGDGAVEEARVLQDGSGGVLDTLEEGDAGVEPADAAAEAVGLQVVERDEGAGVLEEGGIGGGWDFGFGDKAVGQAMADDGAGEVEQRDARGGRERHEGIVMHCLTARNAGTFRFAGSRCGYIGD